MEITGANCNWCHTVRFFKMLPRHVDKGTVARKGVGYSTLPGVILNQAAWKSIRPSKQSFQDNIRQFGFFS